MEMKISKLAKLTMPLFAALAIAACGGGSGSSSGGGGSDPAPSIPQETPNVPSVVLPGETVQPSAEELALSYVVDTSAASSFALNARAADYNAWVLSCADQSFTPAASDDFGPTWLISVSEVEACSDYAVTDDEGSERASFSLGSGLGGKSLGLSDSVSDPMEASRQSVLLTEQGLSQEGTDVTLPSYDLPGDHPAATAGEIAVQLYDPQGLYAEQYEELSLHLWNVVDGTLDSSVLVDWGDTSLTPDAVDENGPVWYLPINDDAGQFGLIIRESDGATKVHGNDIVVNGSSMSEERSVTYLPGDYTVFASRDDAVPSSEFLVTDVSAIMLDDSTVSWGQASGAATVQFMVNPVSTDGVVSGASIVLESASLSEELRAKYPHLADAAAFTLPELPASLALKDLFKGEIYAIASDADGNQIAATAIQYAGALDALYAEQAAELEYGAIVDGDATTFRLWAPTATAVELVVYNANKGVNQTVAMVEDRATGSWSVELPTADVDRLFYRYAMTVYQPNQQKTFQYEVTDPYSLSLSMNSLYSQVVNLDDADLKPSGWDSLAAPHSQDGSALANMVIYEAHVRDFSSTDETTENRGKYLALTETGTTPVEHLRALSEAGLTHLHLMPVFDIATINEDPAQVANIDDDFSKLCEVNPAVNDSEFAGYCASGSTIAEVFAELVDGDSAENPQVQALNEYVRGVDGYNWGYDPFHFTVPEGSYATDAEGTQRIVEFREMVQSVKDDLGLNIVVDVVYNHTNASGLADKSVFDKVVPMYYQRLSSNGQVETSTCCDNTAPEHAMYAKFIDDSIKVWVDAYKIDAFRWDLMGHHPLEQMVNTLEAARTVNPEVYFYGEGWNFGEVENDRRFVQATQPNLFGTGIGSFSDRLRDAVRGGSPFDEAEQIRATQGFGNGALVAPNELVEVDDSERTRALHQADLTRLGMAGNLADFVMVTHEGRALPGSAVDYNGQPAGYAKDPWEIQNYVSKHDNQTLWDINMYKVSSDMSPEERLRMQAVGLSTVLLGQAMPFTHMGVELLRSKSMQRDSYDFGDWYNKVDFTLNDNNWNKGLPAAEKDQANYEVIEPLLDDPYSQPTGNDMIDMVDMYKELLSVRAHSNLLTLPSGQEIINRVDFRNAGAQQTPGLIVMTIDNGTSQGVDIDQRYDGAVVIVNASPDAQTIAGLVSAGAVAELSPAHSVGGSIASGAMFSEGSFSLDAWSSAVFVLPRGDERGEGVPPSEKTPDVPPFAPQKVYVAGGFNDWTVDGTEMDYIGNGIYQVDIAIDAATEYKVTLGDWDLDNFGCPDGPWGNCAVDYQGAGVYRLTFDASDIDNVFVDSDELVDVFADIDMYVPGNQTNWSQDEGSIMTYSVDDDATYSYSFSASEQFEFKITGNAWGVHEHGANDIVVAEGSLPIEGENNIVFTPAEAGDFYMHFDMISKELSITVAE